MDGKHNEFINEFNNDENNKIPNLKKTKNEFIKILEKNNIDKLLSIEQVMDYQDKIKDITTEINLLKSKKKRLFFR